MPFDAGNALRGGSSGSQLAPLDAPEGGGAGAVLGLRDPVRGSAVELGVEPPQGDASWCFARGSDASAESPSSLVALRAGAIAARIPCSLPERAELGVSTVHRYEDRRMVAWKITVTGFIPLPSPAFQGAVLDLNAKRLDEVIPHRAIMSDLHHTRAFIGIDQRPGTPLDRWLTKIAACIPRGILRPRSNICASTRTCSSGPQTNRSPGIASSPSIPPPGIVSTAPPT